MKAIDTNLLVRLVLNDDEKQVRAAKRILQSNVLITATVLLEFIWVLQSNGNLTREEVMRAIRHLSSVSTVTIVAPEACAEFLRLWSSGIDVEDALHLAFVGEVDAFLTFDRAFAKRARKAKSVVEVAVAG
jgi:predicted nucleic-acid-binding protein